MHFELFRKLFIIKWIAPGLFLFAISACTVRLGYENTPASFGMLCSPYILCSEDLMCVSEVCAECSDDVDCMDDSECSVDSCVAGTCEWDFKFCGVATCDTELDCGDCGTCDEGICNFGDATRCGDCGSCNEGVCDFTDATVCDDGDATTYGDVCDGAGLCAGTPIPVCDDGVFCNGIETFNEGSESCDAGVAPCSGSVCNSCQEVAQSCFDPVYTICDDSDAATYGDVCDGGGVCAGFPIPWVTGFSDAHAIDINNSDSTLTDYSIRFVFDSAALIAAGKMAADCGDVVFTDVSGTVLSHWVEGLCDTTTTHIWVKVPTLLGGATTVWMFHNNTGHTDLGNPDDIFILFDDFDAGLGKWGLFGTPLPTTFSNAGFRDGMGFATNGDANYRSGAYSLATVPVDQSLRVFTRLKQVSGGVNWNMIYNIGITNQTTGFTQNGIPAFITVGIYGNTPDAHPENTNDITLNSIGSSGLRLSGANDEAFHTWEMSYDPVAGLTSFYSDDTLFLADKVTDVPAAAALPFGISGRDYNDTNFIDWVAVALGHSEVVDAVFGAAFVK